MSQRPKGLWGRGAELRVIAPVCGTAVTLHEPRGADDLLLLDSRVEDPRLARELLQRVGETESKIDWGELAVADADALLMRLRQLALGDRIRTSLTCSAGGCGTRVEISFSVDAYLSFHRPHTGPITRRGWSVSEPDGGGWRTITAASQGEGRFRLPTLNDQIAVAARADAMEELAARCIQLEAPRTRLATRIETALSLCAPPLSGPLEGRCPDCGTFIVARFEARTYCLQELAFRARYLYDDVDLLARRYHWPERTILSMPYARRTEYAERARRGDGA